MDNIDDVIRLITDQPTGEDARAVYVDMVARYDFTESELEQLNMALTEALARHDLKLAREWYRSRHGH